MGEIRALNVIPAEMLGSDIIQCLENVLEKAHAGELSSVAIASVFRDGCVASSWSSPPNASLLIGAIARMQSRLTRWAEE